MINTAKLSDIKILGTSIVHNPRGQYTVKPVLSGHSKRRPKLVFKTNYCLMQVKSIAESQYFRPLLSYHLSLRSLFYLF